MPKEMEFFSPPKKSPETKPEGTVSDEDGVKIWRADETEFAASSGSSESRRVREFVVPKKEGAPNLIDEKKPAEKPTPAKLEIRKSDNVSKMTVTDPRRSGTHFQTKQYKEGRENILAKRARKKIISSEAERYGALFDR